MLLVECEFCSSRGILVAYHEECLKKAMGGETIELPRGTFGGVAHLLKAYIEELMEQRESEDTPILIPAQFEACYQCGVFRGGKRSQWFITDKGLSQVKGAISLRREQNGKFIIGDVKVVIIVEEGDEISGIVKVEKETPLFTIDSMLEDFYFLQPEF